jgi:GTPase SAR1 family protein
MTKPSCIQELESSFGLQLTDLALLPKQLEIIEWQAMVNAYAAEREDDIPAFWLPTALQRMRMSICQNTYMLDEAGNVIALNLYQNGLTHFEFKNPAEWQHLRVLFLAENLLSQLWVPAALSRLECLDISDNLELSTIEFEAPLPLLDTLEGSDSGLTHLELFDGFQHLKKIDLSRSKLHSLIFQGDCPALEWLDLSGNQLQSLEFPAGFQDLAYLYLAKNPNLKTLQVPQALSKLEVLNVDECNLEELPMDTILSPAMVSLYANGNTPKNIPYIFLGTSNSQNCLQKARLWFAEIKSAPTERNKQIKLMLLGNGSAGKSTLLCALENGKCTCKDRHESTHGVQLKALSKGEVVFNVWDFGGQEIYHGTHRLFMESPAVQLILFDPQIEQAALDGRLRPDRKNDELVADQPIEYWYETAKTLSEKSHFLFVQNKLDEYPKVDDRVRNFTLSIGAEFRQISALSGEKLRWVELFMEELAKELPDYNMLMPASWLAVRDYFAQNLDKRTVPLEFFEQLCVEKKVHPETTTLLRDYLHHSGFIYYHPNLQDTIIVDQNWALNAIYKLLDREAPYFKDFRNQGHGQVMTYRIFELFGDGYTPEQKRLFLSFMESCGICFKLNTAYSDDEEIAESDVYVFTEFLSLDKSSSAEKDWNERTAEVYTFRHSHDFINRYAIAEFIAALGRKTDIRYIWRNGIQVQTVEGWFKVEIVDAPKKAIVVSIERKAIATWLKPIFEKLDLQGKAKWEYSPGMNAPFQVFDIGQLEKETFFAATAAFSDLESKEVGGDFKNISEKIQESNLRVLLFLAANPRNTTMISHEKEFAFMHEEMDKRKRSGLRYELHKHSKSTFISFIDQVKEWKPHILHFVGHGITEEVEGGVQPVGQIIFHGDDDRDDDKVDSQQLKAAFADFLSMKCPLKLVFLNACLSDLQAKAISETGLTVIGSNRAINSEVARRFAAHFYDAYRESEDVVAAAQNGFVYASGAKKYLEIYQNGKKIDFQN